jgi:phage anti-repressor protein
VQERIKRCGFKEGVDCAYHCKRAQGKGRHTKEYWFTISAAYLIAPRESERGRQVVEYLLTRYGDAHQPEPMPFPADIVPPSPVVAPPAPPTPEELVQLGLAGMSPAGKITATPAAPVVDVPAEPPVMEPEVVPPDDELIPFELESGQPFPVNARGLHEYLQVGRDFSNWIKDRIEKFQLIKGKDYEVFAKSGENPLGGRPSNEYWLTITTARWLSADVHSERGRRVIKYLVARDDLAELAPRHCRQVIPRNTLGRGKLSSSRTIRCRRHVQCEPHGVRRNLLNPMTDIGGKQHMIPCLQGDILLPVDREDRLARRQHDPFVPILIIPFAGGCCTAT